MNLNEFNSLVELYFYQTKKQNSQKTLPCFGGYVGCCLLCWGSHFSCFFRVHLFRLLGDPWAPKATERVPKWSPKWWKSWSKGTLWNVSKAWQALYGRDMGRYWGGPRNQFFQERGAKASPYATEEGSGWFFVILGALWGSLGAPFSEENVFGSRSDFCLIFESLLGGAGGRG